MEENTENVTKDETTKENMTVDETKLEVIVEETEVIEQQKQSQDVDVELPQLTCKICETKRHLTEDEVKESIDIINRHNMKPNQILNIWSALDGDVCPEGGNHDYAWYPSFRENIMNYATKRKNNEVEIVRNSNLNIELKNDYDKLKKDTEAEVEKIKQEMEQKIREITESPYKKIKEIQDKIKKNQEANAELEKLNPDIEENILKVSGREWRQWL